MPIKPLQVLHYIHRWYLEDRKHLVSGRYNSVLLLLTLTNQTVPGLQVEAKHLGLEPKCLDTVREGVLAEGEGKVS